MPPAFDPTSDYGALLSDPSVRASIRKKVASHSLPAADTNDIVEQVLEALWRRRDDERRPTTQKQLLALAATVAMGKINDYFRHKYVVQAHIATNPGADVAVHDRQPGDAPGDVEEIAPPRSMTPEQALTVKEQLAFVNRQLAAGVITPDEITVMEAHAFGDQTFEELAAERGVPAATLRSRIHRVRRRMLRAWIEFSLFTKTTTIMLLILLLLVVVVVVAAALRRREPPPRPPQPAPTETTLQPAPRPPVREAPAPIFGDPKRSNPVQ